MIDTNKKIFTGLIDFANKTDHYISNGTRYIRTEQDEKKWLMNVKIDNTLKILPRLTMSIITFQNERYIVVIGLDSQYINYETEFFQQEDLNAGLATVILGEMEIPLIQHIDVFKIVNNLESQCKEDAVEYSGHDYRDICSFYNPICVFKILPQCPVNNNIITRLSTIIMSDNGENLSLLFSEPTLQIFQQVAVSGSKNIPFESLLFSLSSFDYKYSFLNVYHCLERLLMVPFIKEFYLKLDPKPNYEVFYKQFIGFNGWKPKEEHALIKIFKSLPDKLLDDLFVFRKAGDPKSVNDYDKTARWFYKVRNTIVHSRLSGEVNIENLDWDSFIATSLQIVEFLYSEFSDYLI